MFDKLIHERIQEVKRLSEKRINNLVYYFKGKSAQKYFICFNDPLILYVNIKGS